MDKYKLTGKISKYVSIVAVFFIAAHYGMSISFDKNKFTDLNKRMDQY